MNGLNIGGLPVLVHTGLPLYPSELENVTRRVRHGLADVLEWLGEEVGPKPGEPTTHAIHAGDALWVSEDFFEKLRAHVGEPIRAEAQSVDGLSGAWILGGRG